MLGRRDVYRYTAGKADWVAAGFESEGRESHGDRAGSLARRDFPTCHPSDSCSAALERLGDADERVVVVDERGVVLGVVSRGALASGRDEPCASRLEPAPSTVRYDQAASPLFERMAETGSPTTLVTDPDGVLLGVLRARGR